MPIEVLMPALSPTMEKGNLAKWLKKEGEPVKTGDVIAEIETDKATMEVEAIDDGTLGKILVPEGTNDVAVNTPIAMILAQGEDKTALKDGKQANAAAAAATAPSGEQKGAESAPPAAVEPAKAPAPAPTKTGIIEPSRLPMAEPDVPAGTEMVTMTMREALRDARVVERRLPGVEAEVGDPETWLDVELVLQVFANGQSDRPARRRNCRSLPPENVAGRRNDPRAAGTPPGRFSRCRHRENSRCASARCGRSG